LILSTQQNLNNHFSPEGNAVLEQARKSARQYRHSHITPEHLLLGILAAGEAETMKVIKRGRATPQQMAELVKHHLRAGENDPAEELNFSERGKRVLEAARVESVRVQSEKIAPAHILLGLSRVPNTVAAAVLGAVDLKGDDMFR
jgi:ATP-dependent Clp protease ATP-binding subunit ClpC